jgi:hypothetical protein
VQNLTSQLRPKTQPWRNMTIAIDGIDHSGKSTLARYLAWQLGMPAIETDLMIIEDSKSISRDVPIIERLIKMRHDMNRPVIVEGVFVLKIFNQLGFQPDVLIRTECQSNPRQGAWPVEFSEYNTSYPRSVNPDYSFVW